MLGTHLNITQSEQKLVLRSSRRIYIVALLLSLLFVAPMMFIPIVRFLIFGLLVIMGFFAFNNASIFELWLPAPLGDSGGFVSVIILMMLFFPCAIFGFLTFTWIQEPHVSWVLCIPIFLIVCVLIRTNTTISKTEEGLSIYFGGFKSATFATEDLDQLLFDAVSSRFTINGREITGPFLSSADRDLIEESLNTFINTPVLEYEKPFDVPNEKYQDGESGNVSVTSILDA